MLPKAGDPYIKENKDKIISAGTSCDISSAGVRTKEENSERLSLKNKLDLSLHSTPLRKQQKMKEARNTTILSRPSQKTSMRPAALRGISDCSVIAKVFNNDSGYFSFIYQSADVTLNCRWRISSSKQPLKITFHSFNVGTKSAQTNQCDRDKVQILDCQDTSCTGGSTLGPICGLIESQSFTTSSSASTVEISLSSESNLAYVGFCISWGTEATCPYFPSAPPTPTVKILEEATMKPAGYDQQLVSYIATQIYSKPGVTYMRYAFTATLNEYPVCDCSDWSSEASCPNLVTNGSVLLFYLGTNRNVAQMYLRLTACFRYQDITLPSPNYDSYSNMFMPAPKITFSLPIGSDSCNGKNSTQEWRSVVQQFLNSSISYAQQIVSTNIVPAIEPKGSWKATAGVIVGSTVKSSALVNLLLDSRDSIKSSFSQQCPPAVPDAQWVISVDTQITKRTRGEFIACYV